MALYTMRLEDGYFEKIQNGTKTLECRLYDEKRQGLNLGDTIEFIDANNDARKIMSEVIALHRSPSFSELFDQFPIQSFGGESKEQMLSMLKMFHSPEDEKKYGVVGIEIKVIEK